ncbi:MAG: TetR family transcriptional regulator [Pseudomonadota bacterium]
MANATAKKKTPTGETTGRETLLAAASALMIELGTFDVSLHQIARRAELTAPLVKYYFGSKDGLLIALATRDTERSLVQLEELLAMDIDPASKLRIHITGIIRTYARHPYLNGLLDSLLKDDHSESARTMQASFVRPLIEAQRKIIEDGIAIGQFRPVDPNYAYFLIIGACQYIFSTRVAYRELVGNREVDDALAREYAAFVIDTILNGIMRA